MQHYLQDDFRRYFNVTIAPELMRQEHLRMRLMGFLLLSVIFIFMLLLLGFYLGIWALTLGLSIPIGFFISYLLWRIEDFRRNFKPRVVNLILDYIDNGLNFDPTYPLRYSANGYLSKELFMASRIFDTPAQEYYGEDKIEGKVGEMVFEMSELRVGEISALRNQIKPVFSGVFLHAKFNEPTSGIIICWPRHRLQYLTKSIRAFTFQKGKDKDKEIMSDAFRKIFMTFSTDKTPLHHILTEPIQAALAEFVSRTGKTLYLSIINEHIYIGMSSQKDMLEPYIFRNNNSFQRVKEFFDDILTLLLLIEIFDRNR